MAEEKRLLTKEQVKLRIKAVKQMFRESEDPYQFFLDLGDFLGFPGKIKQLEESLDGLQRAYNLLKEEIATASDRAQIPDLPEIDPRILDGFEFYIDDTGGEYYGGYCGYHMGQWYTFKRLENDKEARKKFATNIKNVVVTHRKFYPTCSQIKFALAKLEELLFKVEPEAPKPAEETKPELEAKVAEQAKDPVKELDPENIYFAVGADWYSLDEIMADAAVKSLFQKAFTDPEKGYVRVRKNRFAVNVVIKEQNLAHLPEDLKDEYRKLRAVFLGQEATVATEPAKTDAIDQKVGEPAVGTPTETPVVKPVEASYDPQTKPKLEPLSDEEIEAVRDSYGQDVKYSIDTFFHGTLKDIRHSSWLRYKFDTYRKNSYLIYISADGYAVSVDKIEDAADNLGQYKRFKTYLHLLDRLLFATDCGDEKKSEKQEQPKPDEKSQTGADMSKPKVLYGLFGHYLGHSHQLLDEIRASKDLCERYRKAFVEHVNIKVEVGGDIFTMGYDGSWYEPYMSGYNTSRTTLIKYLDELWEVVFECEGISTSSACQHGDTIGGRWVAESNIQKYPRLQEIQRARIDRRGFDEPRRQTGSSSSSKGDAPYPMGDVDDLVLPK